MNRRGRSWEASAHFSKIDKHWLIFLQEQEIHFTFEDLDSLKENSDFFFTAPGWQHPGNLAKVNRVLSEGMGPHPKVPFGITQI